MKTSELEKMSLLKSIPREIESKAEEPAYCIEYLDQPFYRDLKDMVGKQISSCEDYSLIQKILIKERYPGETLFEIVLELLEY